MILVGGQLSSTGSFRVPLLSASSAGGEERASGGKAHLLLNSPGPEVIPIIWAQSHWQKLWQLNAAGGQGNDSLARWPRPNNSPNYERRSGFFDGQLGAPAYSSRLLILSS